MKSQLYVVLRYGLHWSFPARLRRGQVTDSDTLSNILPSNEDALWIGLVHVGVGTLAISPGHG